MSAVDPLNAVFGMVGGVAFGLTGLAVGPFAAPLLLLLLAGTRLAAG